MDGPLAGDTIAYVYDELGRMTGQSVNGSANETTWEFDALGRMTTETNLLGTFTYEYDGYSDRLSSVNYPNNQTSNYAYFGNEMDRRLRTIHHKYPSGATMAKFDYTYDAVGNIATWQQQADSAAVSWAYGYDLSDQITLAVKRSTDSTPVVLKRYAYTYDILGNRTAEQIDDAVTGATYDNMNRLLTQQPGGVLRFVGTLSESATVSIGGRPAAVAADDRFVGQVPVAGGAQAVTIVATDPAGNSATAIYDLEQTGSTRAFTYDGNGNLTGDGARTFEWDARNQLVALSVGPSRVEFAYNGLGQRVRRVEREGGSVVDEVSWVPCDWEVCEERSADGTTVLVRMFRRGEHAGGVARFLARDHLDSIRVESDATGAVVGRYDFDPWGRMTVTSGVERAPSYAGLDIERVGGLHLGLFRWYDPELGRWGSEDPSGTIDGPNLFAYVRGRPIAYIDPDGLQSVNITDPKVQRQPGLPKQCPPNACGCTDPSLTTSCECKDNGWILTATYTATIYINTKKWTPESWIERHERGHFTDDVQVLRQVMQSRSGPYPSEPACQAAAKAMMREFKDKADAKARDRDFLVKKLCWP